MPPSIDQEAGDSSDSSGDLLGGYACYPDERACEVGEQLSLEVFGASGAVAAVDVVGRGVFGVRAFGYLVEYDVDEAAGSAGASAVNVGEGGGDFLALFEWHGVFGDYTSVEWHEGLLMFLLSVAGGYYEFVGCAAGDSLPHIAYRLHELDAQFLFAAGRYLAPDEGRCG